MTDISNQIQILYRYNGKIYVSSRRKDFKMYDLFIDCRDFNYKIIDSENDLIKMVNRTPELYILLDEVTIQN